MAIEVRGKTFKSFLTSTQIQQRIQELGATITQEYRDKNPLFVVVLNGAFMFAADLLRAIEFSAEVTFVKFTSYRSMESSGTVDELIGFQEDLRDRHIILLEDIIDTGNTMNEVKSLLQDFRPASVEIVSMFFKPDALRHKLDLKYYGFELENKFIIGYGMDWDGFGRNLPQMYILDEK